ncbi:hypothetical protein GQX74_004872 [Glossina fuscipes]|nr:hypothetical protein GQX74_004872 [Glossina fuscipes]
MKRANLRSRAHEDHQYKSKSARNLITSFIFTSSCTTSQKKHNCNENDDELKTIKLDQATI